MEKLKRLALSLILMSVLAAVAFGGETQSPPCVPGETASPPCSPMTDPTTPGETSTPPASSTSVDVTDLTEAVIWALSLF